MNFPNEEVSWEEFLLRVKSMPPRKWIYRGQVYKENKEHERQLSKEPLMSSLERTLNAYDISLSDAPEIEKWMIRDFKRKYDGIDSDIASEDTFYCLALMQHYGCPMRLLDFTYSPYVAAFFAVDNVSLERGAERNAFVYCLNHKWINDSAKKNIHNGRLFKMRFRDKTLTDKSFEPLYMGKKRKTFILADNPYQLHKRLSIQRGLFVIQGDISVGMMDNISSMEDWQSKENVVKFKLRINTAEELGKVYEDLRLMYITRESLFPGLDGFSESLKQNLYLYQAQGAYKADLNPFPKPRSNNRKER